MSNQFLGYYILDAIWNAADSRYHADSIERHDANFISADGIAFASDEESESWPMPLHAPDASPCFFLCDGGERDGLISDGIACRSDNPPAELLQSLYFHEMAKLAKRMNSQAS